MPVQLRTVKKGDFFRLPSGKAVYVRGGYDRSEKRFECYRFDDVNAVRMFKADKVVEVGFTF